MNKFSIVPLLLLLPMLSGASALGDLAISMPAGSFAELQTNGLTQSFMTNGGCSSPITSFSDNAVWDPQSRKFLFVGGPHGCPHVFAQYSESSNTWSYGPQFVDVTGGLGRATHGYDHLAINPQERVLYFKRHGEGYFMEYNIDTNNWQNLSQQIPDLYEGAVAGGMDFFPEVGSQGTLYYFSGAFGRLRGLDIGNSNANWTMEASGLRTGGYHNFTEYNPVKNNMIFGGGNTGADQNNEYFVMDTNANVSSKKTAPIGLGIYQTIITHDPVSGDYLVFANNKRMYVMDEQNNTFSDQGKTAPFFDESYDSALPVVATVAAPISTYGVVMFLQHRGSGDGGPAVWLYKHERSEIDSMPPNALSDFSAE